MPATVPLPQDTRPQPPLGLRERKKLKTRLAIRRATYRLIRAQGYESTTIEQIAEAAEVSPSTVFRYFPTKEDIVLTDEFGPLMEAELRARPEDEDPVDAVRAVIRLALAAFLREHPEEALERTRLMAEVPALRTRTSETAAATFRLLVHAVADRVGRPHDDLDVRTFVAAVTGVLREVTVYWAERDHQDDLLDLVDRGLRALGTGPRF
ncbi:TetR/AcrR family transcriptional regulator [Streptomyces sp. NPDC057638]|uniref:TetR/AcrR family transcriptional regulator n=1 Tax=Streptomyces sp. NPDC057638 TaxID=3346190 RepID=UPI0036C57272